MLVSVITPAYIRNDTDLGHLYEAVHSVREQSWGEVEMVIVNDSSPMRAPALAELMHGYSIAKMYHAIGRGVASARNQAVSLAKGRLILPLDHDDLLDEDAVKILVGALEDENGFVYPGVLEFGGGAAIIRKPRALSDYDLLDHNPFPVGCLISKATIMEVGGWRDGLDGLEDWEFWLRCLSKGKCGIGVDAPLYWYRQRDDSLSRNIDDRESKISLIREIYKEVNMACCGGKKSPKGVSRTKTKTVPVSPARAPVETVTVGVDGMTELEYLLIGGSRWWGGARNPTKQKYRFGGDKKFGLVDNKDVAYFLSIREGSKQVFKLAGAQPSATVETKIIEVVSQGGVAAIQEPVTTELLKKSHSSALIDIPEVGVVQYKEETEYIKTEEVAAPEEKKEEKPRRGRPKGKRVK